MSSESALWLFLSVLTRGLVDKNKRYILRFSRHVSHSCTRTSHTSIHTTTLPHTNTSTHTYNTYLNVVGRAFSRSESVRWSLCSIQESRSWCQEGGAVYREAREGERSWNNQFHDYTLASSVNLWKEIIIRGIAASHSGKRHQAAQVRSSIITTPLLPFGASVTVIFSLGIRFLNHCFLFMIPHSAVTWVLGEFLFGIISAAEENGPQGPWSS